MSKTFAFLITAALMSATPALAQNATCVEPAPPTMIDGNTATADQLRATIADVKDFIAKSDVYQQCVADDLEAKKQAASKAGTPFDTQVEQVALAKVAANQQEKDKLAADINTQIAVFKQKSASK